LLGGNIAVSKNELISKMIKGASETMNDVTCNETEFGHRGLDIKYAINVISRMRIRFHSDFVGLTIHESVESDFKITEVLFGPLNF
jgi:hypothetical protein